jgi:hypothetical protein
MKLIIGCTIAALSLALVSLATAADAKHPGDSEKPAGFEQIKALSGEWTVTHAPEGHGAHEGSVTYKVTAGGSAVLETLFGGSEHEMVTLYYMEGDHLALTHYCMLQNRPHMRAEKTSTPDTLVFKCPAGEDPKLEAETHMHQVTFTFVDADHLKAEWVLYKDGKQDSTHMFEMARKKK